MINWKIRYSKILENYPELFDESKSILEVGSGAFGVSQYLKRPVVGLEPTWTETPVQWITPVQGSILESGFAADSFDIVLCVDVMEHLKQEDRGLAINEMIRIAKDKVIISCPCGHISLQFEKLLASLFGSNTPSWLSEHLKNGLPTVADILAPIIDGGYSFKLTGNEAMLQHYAGILLDHCMSSGSNLLNKMIENKAPVKAPLLGSNWDLFYSYVFIIDKTKPTPKSFFPINDAGVSPQKGLRLYAAFHEELPTNHLGDGITPIYVGEAGRRNHGQAATDVLSNNDSLDNSRWSELSAIYAVWKESSPKEYIGFCHYRRFFKAAEPGANREIRIRYDQIAAPLSIPVEPAENRIIVPMPFPLENTIWDQYCMEHGAEQIALMYSVVSEKTPELAPFIAEHFVDARLYSNNMFIASWAMFNELCSVWFSVLREVENLLPAEAHNRYQARDLSFLAERLFDLWLRYRRSKGSEIIETQIYLVEYPNLDVSKWTPSK